MTRPDQQIFERLGSDGLRRTLDDLFDQGRLVRLATTCGLKYRGMRTQTQRRERLLADLVAKAASDDKARRAIFHALQKETAPAAKEWEGLSAPQKCERLCDAEFLGRNGNLGTHLYLLAALEDDAALDGCGTRLAATHLLRLTARAPGAPAPAEVPRDDARARRKLSALEKKLGYADAQLAKSRELQRSLKRDLIERKGELAESRMLAERLRGDLASARTEAEMASAKNGSRPAPDERSIEELATAVRRLENAQRKLVHAVASRREPVPAPRREEHAAVAAVKEAAERVLKAQLERQRAEIAKELEAQTRRIEELRAELLKIEEGTARRGGRRAKGKGPGARVGVFIDVQNVYYAARRLKGKLDFDALLRAAVRERRLIQATAYVVESSETDQSQFIARLEQLAIKVQRKPLKVRADGSMKGNWDMELALDVLDAAPSLDVVILVSGDGDFTSLVKRIKGMGPRVEVVGFPRHTAKSLVEAADEFLPLDRRFMIYPERSAMRQAQGEESAAPAEATRVATAPDAAAAPPEQQAS